MLLLHLFFSLNWHTFVKKKTYAEGQHLFKTTKQIKASSLETTFYYRENMSKKRASAETASTLNNKKKDMTRCSKDYEKKCNFVLKCSTHEPNYEYKFNCTVCNVNL